MGSTMMLRKLAEVEFDVVVVVLFFSVTGFCAT